MKPSQNSSASLVRSLDINDVKFNSDGVIDFYWPLNNEKTTEVMNSITSIRLTINTGIIHLG